MELQPTVYGESFIFCRRNQFFGDIVSSDFFFDKLSL